MIDFVKMSYKDKSEIEDFILNENNFHEIRAILEMHSGKIEYPYKTKLKNIEVKVTKNRVYLQNSIHKLNNIRKRGEDKNHNDFKYSELIENIDYLNNKLIKLNQTRLSILEFGLNIEIDTPAEMIIRDNIIMHHLKLHSINDKFRGKGELKQFIHSNYSIKVYDKAKQYEVNKNILRFEVKHTHSKSFNQHGIYSINDLSKKDSLNKLFDDLLQRFNKMLIIDNYRNIGLPKKIETYINKCTGYNYWESLSDRKLRNKKIKEVKMFNEILEKYNLLETKKYLREKLISKFSYLIKN